METLENKEILIIEDDVRLQEDLKYIFEDICKAHTKIVNNKNDGLSQVMTNGLNFNLIIVDVMLPESEKEFKEIDVLERELDKLTEVFREAELNPTNDPKFKIKYQKAQGERQKLLAKISKLINKLGGIEIIRAWEIKKPLSNNYPPILFLTALGDKETMAQGIKIGDGIKVGWLVKPVTEERLILIANNLVKESEKS